MDKLHPDRLFPADPNTRAIARTLYKLVTDLPIISDTISSVVVAAVSSVLMNRPSRSTLTRSHSRKISSMRCET